jgi:hypothetical protein
MRPRPDPVPARMSGRSALARGVAAVVVFAVSFAVGNALDDDDPAAPSQPPSAEGRSASSEVRANRTAAPLGSLRLERAPALPDLRGVPAARGPDPAAAPARSAETPAPAVESDEAPASDGGYSPPAPEPYVTSPAPSNPAPPSPSPPANPPPSNTNAPQPASPTPAPDPAPAPAPAPTPDPSPSGGSGQYAGP